MITINKEKLDNIVADRVRRQRDSLIAETDWTQGRDLPAAMSNKWKPYRQALRDVTLQEGFPHNVTWPEKPALH